MVNFDEAVKSWTKTINDWYSMETNPVEVKSAFNALKKWRDSMDEPGEIPYVKTFFKDRDDNWHTGLDTVDREHLAGFIDKIRSQPIKPPPGAPKEDLIEYATEVIERQLNELYDFGLTNQDLKILLSTITTDIDRGFVGEPC